MLRPTIGDGSKPFELLSLFNGMTPVELSQTYARRSRRTITWSHAMTRDVYVADATTERPRPSRH